jgi:cytochrome c5
MKQRMIRLAAAGLLLGPPACGDGDEHGGDEHGGDEHGGEATSGASCPPDSLLTYESFGREFMATYCTSCHADGINSSARRGAPNDYNFDTLEDIQEVGAGHLDQLSAAGDARVNDAMPPPGFEPQPSEVERRRLGEWLACGVR